MAQRAERKLRRAMEGLSWLVYRINTPVLRAMFMDPGNRLQMRDGLVTMLAGNLEVDRTLFLPVLAFKLAYYTLCGLRRIGVWSTNDRTSPAVAAE